MASFINWLLIPYRNWKYKQERKKILEKLREQDPFIY